MTNPRHAEWLNQNRLRRYPFIDSAPTTLPDDFLVDVVLVAPNTLTLPFHLARIYLTPGIVSLLFRDTNDNTVGLASGAITPSGDFLQLAITSVGTLVSGLVTLGPGLQQLLAAGQSLYEFTPADTEIVTSAVTMLDGAAVTGIGLAGDDTILIGDIAVQVGDTIALTVDPVTNAITLSLKNPLDFKSLCFDSCQGGQCKKPAIYTLNNVTPDANGNIVLDGDGTVVVVNDGPQHRLRWGSPYKINDICPNKTKGPKGEPGEPGPKGAAGPKGVSICGESDCLCTVCDSENIDLCDDIEEAQPPL